MYNILDPTPINDGSFIRVVIFSKALIIVSKD